MRRAFWKGVWLWEALQEMPGFAERGGELEFEGVRQDWKHANPESPCGVRPLSVRCVVEEKDVDAAPGYETATAIENTLHAVEALLLANWTSAGPLCYCENHERKAAISGDETAGSNVTVNIGSPGGGWVPATGELVLFRKKTTGEGFTSVIESVSSGVIVCDLEQNLSNSWEVVRVERVFTEVVYRTMQRAGPRDESDPQRDVREVTYQFSGYGEALVPTASVLAHDAS